MATKNNSVVSILIIAALALGNAGSTLYLPAMPEITQALHTNASIMKLSLSLFLIGFGVSQLFYGPLSDAFGRRVNLLVGIFIFLIGSLISAFASNIDLLLLGRLVEGVGIGAANAVGYALLRDVYSGHKLTAQLSYASIFVGMTPIIAPIIGGYLVSNFGWPSCFYFLSILSVLLFSLKIWKLPETNQSAHPSACHPKVVFKNYKTLLTSPVYMGFALAAGFAFSSVFTMGSMLPFLLVNQLHVSTSIYGWIAGIPALGYISGAFLGGKLASRFGLVKLIVLGAVFEIVFSLIGVWLNFYSFNIETLIAPLLLFMLGIGFILPTASSGAMAPFPKLAGSESALLCAFMFCCAAIFTAIGSHLKTNSPVPVFCLLGSTAIFVLIFLALSQKKVKK